MKTTIKQRPILFSTPMVQGILQNRKLKTRRTNGLDQVNKDPNSWYFDRFGFKDEKLIAIFKPIGDGFGNAIPCPYGEIGDQLWVRETWNHHGRPDNVSGFKYAYKANQPDNIARMHKWKPSIHMPRAASRLLLEITDIRVERLQCITEEDAIAEGVEKLGFGTIFYKHYQAKSLKKVKGQCSFIRGAIDSFFTLWESLNGYGSVDADPWLWVIKFKVVEGNV